MDDLRTLLSEYDVPAAFWVTIKLTVLSAIGALIIGTFVAVMRVSPIAVLRGFGTAYVTVVRNTPLTLIVFFCAFGLYNNLGLRLAPDNSPTSIVDNNFRFGVVALAVYHAAFVAEAMRSGINTVPQGQAEAARAIGLRLRAHADQRGPAPGVPGGDRAAGQRDDRVDQEHDGGRHGRCGRGVVPDEEHDRVQQLAAVS